MNPSFRYKILLPFLLICTCVMNLQADTIEPQTNIVLLGGKAMHSVAWSDYLEKGTYQATLVPDFTTQQLGWTLEWGVFPYHPEFCLLQTGTLDALLGIPVEKVKVEALSIVQRLKEKGIEPVFLSALHLPKSHKKENAAIAAINRSLAELAQEERLVFIDLTDALSPSGELAEGFAEPDLGLKPAGAALLGETVRGLYSWLADSSLTSKAEASKLDLTSITSERIQRIMQDAHKTDRFALLGDSITEGGGNWSQRTGIEGIRNCGQGGFTTGQLLWYLKPVLLDSDIHTCFFMAGINDISLGVPTEQILQNIIELMDTLKKHDIRPIIQSTLLQEDDWSVNERIRNFNKRLEDQCKRRGVTFIDINSFMANENGLKPAYSRDGTHLTEAGYEAWSSFLKSYLQENF